MNEEEEYPEEEYPRDWEPINGDTERLRVYGGWMIRTFRFTISGNNCSNCMAMDFLRDDKGLYKLKGR